MATNSTTSTLHDAIFPVCEVPAIGVPLDDKGALEGKEIDSTGHKFIVREDTGQILSCMTDEYKLITNRQVFNYANPMIRKSGGEIKEVSVFSDGARTTVKWHFPNEKVNIRKGDMMTPEIVIRNSYDGTIGLNILAGAFRFVCTNGMIIGVIAQNYKNKHSVYNVSLDDIEPVIDETIKKTKIIFKDEFPILIDNKIKERHIVKFIELFPLQANQVVTQRLIVDKPKTFWDLFNVGTNVLTHHMSRNSESTHTLENSLYGTMKKWALTEVGHA